MLVSNNTKQNNTEQKGWVLKAEREVNDENEYIINKKQKTGNEATLLMMEYSILSGLSRDVVVRNNPFEDLAHGYGMTRQGMTELFKRVVYNTGNAERKQRRDKVMSVFTSEERGNHFFPSFHDFRINKHKQYRVSSDRLDLNELEEE